MFKKQDTSITGQILADLKKPVGNFEKKTCPQCFA